MLFTQSVAALVLAYAASANAAQAYIKNYCSVPVYLWPTDITRNPSQPITIAPGGDYSETYHTLATGGVSLKLSKNANDKIKITQFEYTLIGGFIWYDGSHVDCSGSECPFYADGIYLDASDSSCPKRTCLPNQVCTGFYVNFNDDVNTLSCNPQASVNMYLCSTSASAPAGAAAPAAPAAPAAVSSAAASAPAVSAPAIVAPAAPSKSLPSPVANAQSVAPVVKMEAVHFPTTLHTIAARQTDLAARDVHNHARRHNHGRKH